MKFCKFFLVILIISHIKCFSQEKETYNKIDKNGDKIGVWKEEKNELTYYVTYNKNKKNGIFKCYERKKSKQTLVSKGFYCNDTICNNWIFYENGFVRDSFSQIALNTEFFPTKDNNTKVYKPLFKVYLVHYYPSSKKKKCEGFLYCDEILPFDKDNYLLDYFIKEPLKFY